MYGTLQDTYSAGNSHPLVMVPYKWSIIIIIIIIIKISEN